MSACPPRALAVVLSVVLLGLTGGPARAQDGEAADTTKTTTTLVETIRATEGLDTLATALQAAGLVDTLKSEGPFTVFAPTNAAFAALPKGALKNLFKPASEAELRSILTYHVVTKKRTARAVSGRTDVKTLHGATLGVKATDGTITLTTGESEATLTKTDLEASNGVLHVIDAVLLPPVKTARREGR